MNKTENERLYASLPALLDPPRRAVIDLAALRHNYRALRARMGNATCICVVKADAYGHGARAVAQALLAEGCRFFAVSCLEEAIALREITPDAEILLLGAVARHHISLLAKHQITATVYSEESAKDLIDEATRLGTTVRVHIKLDTGMNRLGFPTHEEAKEQTLATLTHLLSQPAFTVTGIFSHFATADEEDAELTHRQAARFFAITDALEARGLSLGTKHICNSAGALRFAEKYAQTAVRLGIALYGYPPTATQIELQPVMRLECTVSHVHTLAAGERVSYGGTYTPGEERRIATLNVGYADGFLRAYSGASVTVHTKTGDFKARVVGRICMDQCMLDVTDLPVERGDRVTLFGLARSELEELAARAGTIPYESLCAISARVVRVYEE